ncbi:MAG: 2-dehydropantoate 2-reductase [Alphaproteobacteria bacterium]|nr:2-dehydropantoate 2-reductase [Alphaproteobacteria bacterium]
MKICIYGAGAIGGFLGAYLAKAGHEVSLIARGAHLQALQSKGLTLIHAEEKFTTYPDCAEDPRRIGGADAVFVTVKGPALAAVGEGIGPLLGADTPVVFAMNGLPWWYDHGRDAPLTGAASLLDPTGSLRRVVGEERAIGCVVDCPVRIPEPGLVVCNRPTKAKFALGEPDGTASERVLALSNVLYEAGLDGPVSRDIRHEIWAKLVINLSRSPLAVLTGVPETKLSADPAMTEISREMIAEAAAVAAAHGIHLDLDWPRLLEEKYRTVHRPSMLQDWDAQRPMEIDSIGTMVSRFAAEVGLETPTIDRVLAMLRLKAREAGLY